MSKYYIRLVSAAILSACFIFTQAQNSDTLEIHRNERGKINFACLERSPLLIYSGLSSSFTFFSSSSILKT